MRLDQPLVSRRHARVERTADGLVARDLGSTNGTFVNGARVQGAMTIADGDELRVGSARFLVEGAALRQCIESQHVRSTA